MLSSHFLDLKDYVPFPSTENLIYKALRTAYNQPDTFGSLSKEQQRIVLERISNKFHEAALELLKCYRKYISMCSSKQQVWRKAPLFNLAERRQYHRG
jgi:hypothetical protein